MEEPIPSEFAGFVRNVAKRAVDRVAGKVKELQVPVRAIVRAWGRLTDEQKEHLLDQLIAAVQEPQPKTRKTTRSRKKAKT